MKKAHLLVLILLVGCASVPEKPYVSEVKLKIEGVEQVKVSSSDDSVMKSMEVHNPSGQLSNLTFISKNKAFTKLFSGLSVADVTRLWNDICILENDTTIRELNIFINSPGGDAFSGLALADEIERAKRKGFNVVAHSSGIVASAAIPVLAVCSKRFAASGTIFMVHEASLWKWPGRESASDIRAQGQLMDLLRTMYLNKLAKNTKLSVDEWATKEGCTTWFSSKEALNWGLIDKVE